MHDYYQENILEK